MKEFTYLIPSSIQEAIHMRGIHGDSGCFVAGGTEIVPAMTRHKLRQTCLIELSRIQELSFLARDSGGLRIGPLITHAELERSPWMQGAWKALPEASGSIREPAVRNLGTIGGNVAFGGPSGDLLPPLLAFEALLKIEGPAGERFVPISEFFIAPYRTALADGELLTEIRLPEVPDNFGSAFCNVAKFRGLGLSAASVATALSLQNGKIRGARIAIGAASPIPRRIAEAEAFLEGKAPVASVLREAGRLVSEVAEPRAGSIRASPYYKRKVLVSLTERSIDRAVARLRSQSLGGS